MGDDAKINIFLDAEGTIYVPRNNRSYKEFWENPSLESARKMFKLDRNTMKVLKRLRKERIQIYIVSKHDEAILHGLLEHFRIKEFFKEILINGDKGEKIKVLAHRENIPLESCMIIGDNYELDIIPTRREGIRGFLIDRVYNKDIDAPRIQSLLDIVNFI